jgi:hypothetical protein
MTLRFEAKGRMRRAFLALILVSCLSPFPSSGMAVSDLIGRWKLTNEFAETLPETCKGAYVEIAEQSVTAFSGAQMLTAEYRVSKKHNDFVMMFSDIQVNDQPNCHGIAPEIVQKNFATLQIWRMDGDTIKVLAPTLIMELERT